MDFGRLEQATEFSATESGQSAQQKELFEDADVFFNGLAVHADLTTDLAKVEQLATQFGQDGEQLGYLTGVSAETKAAGSSILINGEFQSHQ